MTQHNKLSKSLFILTLASLAGPAIHAQEPLWNQPVQKPSAVPLWFEASEVNAAQRTPAPAKNYWFESEGAKQTLAAPKPVPMPVQTTSSVPALRTDIPSAKSVLQRTASAPMQGADVKRQTPAPAPIVSAHAVAPAANALVPTANAAPVVSAQLVANQAKPAENKPSVVAATTEGAPKPAEDSPEAWIRNAVIAAPQTTNKQDAARKEVRPKTTGAAIVSAANASARLSPDKAAGVQAGAPVAKPGSVAAQEESLIDALPQLSLWAIQVAAPESASGDSAKLSMPPVLKPQDVLLSKPASTPAPVVDAQTFAATASSAALKLSELALVNGELPVSPQKLEMSPQLAAVTLQPPKLLNRSVQTASANESEEADLVSFDLATAIQSGNELSEKQSESSASDSASGKSGKFNSATMIGPLTDSNILFSELHVKDRFETYAAHVPAYRSREEDLITQPAWPMDTYTWITPVFYHKPLYFEQPNLERYGIGTHRLLQPAASSIHFFGSIPLLPYKVLTQHPCEKYYTLGNRRPGNCVPVQRGVVLGQSYVGEIKQFWEPRSGY
jgi:hypothetical protein